MKGKALQLRGIVFVCVMSFFMIFALITPEAGYGADYPNRPITVLVGFPPGGPADLGARVVGEKLSKILGVPVVIKNQPGAGGCVAAVVLKRAKPDGYTLFWATIGVVTSLAIRSDLGYTLDDFTPIAQTVVFPGIIAVRADSPFKNFKQLFDYVKANPGKLTMGTDGVGSSPQLNWTILANQAGLKVKQVPFKGAGPNSVQLLGGHVDFSVTVLGPVMPSLKAGKLRALAFFAPERSSFFPDVPTTKELGYPESARYSFHGYFGPAGLPEEVLAKLAGPIKNAVNDPEVAKTLGKFGVEPKYLDSKDFSVFLKQTLKTYEEIAEKFHLKQ